MDDIKMFNHSYAVYFIYRRVSRHYEYFKYMTNQSQFEFCGLKLCIDSLALKQLGIFFQNVIILSDVFLQEMWYFGMKLVRYNE